MASQLEDVSVTSLVTCIVMSVSYLSLFKKFLTNISVQLSLMKMLATSHKVNIAKVQFVVKTGGWFRRRTSLTHVFSHVVFEFGRSWLG